MKAEDKQEIIDHCEVILYIHSKDSVLYKMATITLAALTAQPVISDDTKRMDWLCAHCVEVRYPLMYGSREMFRAQQDSEEWDLPHHTTLREQVDAAIANEVQE